MRERAKHERERERAKHEGETKLRMRERAKHEREKELSMRERALSLQPHAAVAGCTVRDLIVQDPERSPRS